MKGWIFGLLAIVLLVAYNAAVVVAGEGAAKVTTTTVTAEATIRVPVFPYVYPTVRPLTRTVKVPDDAWIARRVRPWPLPGRVWIYERAGDRAPGMPK